MYSHFFSGHFFARKSCCPIDASCNTGYNQLIIPGMKKKRPDCPDEERTAKPMPPGKRSQADEEQPGIETDAIPTGFTAPERRKLPRSLIAPVSCDILGETENRILKRAVILSGGCCSDGNEGPYLYQRQLCQLLQVRARLHIAGGQLPPDA